MRKMVPLLALLAGWYVVPAAAADVKIGVNIGIPAPPPPPAIVITAPPPMVAIPGSAVLHAPGVSFNVFLFGGRYYSFHEGAWFVAERPGAPWTVVVVDRVPAAVRAVPVRYYRVPPGHAKQRDRDRDDDRGGPPGQAGPPGHAKGKGR
jgi:hypothetical protein